jgi:glutamyl-tRNA reductase
MIGLNYQTAPLELRERLYLTGDDLQRAVATLHQETMAEIAIVSTCNRLEVYANAADSAHAVEKIKVYLGGRASLSEAQLTTCLQNLVDREAVYHLMRVTAGLESLVLGESEILGQVAQAFTQARLAGTTGAVLSRLFQDAIHAGKRARTETAISQHTLSVSHAAVLMAKRQFPVLTKANTLVIGAGRMAELAARALKAQGLNRIRVVNRTSARASDLANRVGVEAMEWGQLHEALRAADLVITATSAPQPILKDSEIFSARDTSQPLVIVDIAVPRNASQSLRDLSNVRLYDIDDLQSVVDDHRARRQSEAKQVEAIIDEELRAYLGWLNSRNAVPTIVALRQKAEEMAALELNRAFQRLPDLTEDEREVVMQMAHRIVNKMLHAPTIALRERAAKDEHYAYLHAMRKIFDLEGEA